jgi:hypothetical protein
MSKHVGGDLLQTLDTNLRTSRERGIPYVPDQTAQSHLFQIIDFLNPEIWDDSLTNLISQEVILTLLQCAARLYESGRATEAVNLIENEDTRAILSLGIQDNLLQIIYQQCVESIRSNKSEVTNAQNCSQQAGMFSVIRKNKAQRLNHQAMVIGHISALCQSHSTSLQNPFDSPRIDEGFMFCHYITLSRSFNICEKSWLVTLLPDIFQWESQNPYTNIEGLNDTLIAPATGITQSICASPLEMTTSPQYPTTPDGIQDFDQKKDTSHPGANGKASNSKLVSPPSAIITDDLQGCMPLGTFPDVPEGFRFEDPLMPSTTTDGGTEYSPRKATADKVNELLHIFDNATFQPQHSKFSTLRNKFLELRTRAMANSSLPSVEAGISVEKKVEESRECKREETIFGAAPDGDWNFVECDDSECIFPFSPPARDEASNYKSVPTPSPLGVEILSTKLHRRMPAAVTSEYRNRTGLATIPEECETVKKVYSHETELDTTVLSELPHVLQQEKLVEVREHLSSIQELGWPKFWKKAELECDSIPADVFATILWMAEVVKAFGLSFQPTSVQLMSVQLSPGSVELALQYSRETSATRLVPKIRGQLKSILGGVGVTEEEFLLVVKKFATSLDNFEVTKIPCQMVYWFGKDGGYRALLVAFAPEGKRDQRG